MEERERLQMGLSDIGAEIARVSAQAESAKDADLLRLLLEKELMLRKEKLLLLEKLEKLEARASAAGLGVGSAAEAGSRPAAAGVGAPPARRRLVDDAAKLLPKSPDDNIIVWDLTYSDRVKSYVDAAGVVDSIRLWASDALSAAVDRSEERAPAPLLVSGLIKTGKSYTLEHLVPAVVAEALRNQQQAEQPAADGGGRDSPRLADMVVLRLWGDQLERSNGAMAMLRSLLNVLLLWAREEQVPMQEGALAAAEADLARPDIGLYSRPAEAIHRFLKAVKVPVLVLCDEVQSLFLPRIGGRLDAAGAEYIRDTFMKRLLVYGPQTMLWCLTGSSMAQTWISVADMPPNGYAVIAGANSIHLPATYSDVHIAFVWQQLQQDKYPHVTLDRRLLELCPRSIALLTVLVGAWAAGGRPNDVAAFVCEFMRSKLIDESRREWALGVEAMPSSQRLAILDLSFPAVGAHIYKDLHPGLQKFLLPHLDKKADGRYYLRDSHQRQLVRLLLDKDGKLRESWSELEFSATLTQLDGGCNMLRLGEAADYLFGPNANRRSELKKPPAGLDAFKSKLQALADDIANKLRAAVAAAGGDQQQQQQPAGGAALGPRELWERQPWFQEVLNSEWNDRDREAYLKNKEARSTHLDMLVFHLRLSRNVLVHMKPWDQEADAAVDVGVIEALPAVLGQSLFVFNETMVEALRLVSKRTAEAAAAQFAGKRSGGTGGGGGWSSGAGSAGSTSRGRGHRSSGGGGGRGRGARALPDQSAPSRMGPAAAGCGQRPPLVHATSGSRGGWGKREPRAPTLAPRLRVRVPLLASAAAAASAIGLRLPCW